jgi:hypothetical protein
MTTMTTQPYGGPALESERWSAGVVVVVVVVVAGSVGGPCRDPLSWPHTTVSHRSDSTVDEGDTGDVSAAASCDEPSRMIARNDLFFWWESSSYPSLSFLLLLLLLLLDSSSCGWQ